MTSEFFLDDEHFLGEIPLKPDEARRTAFVGATQRAQDLARLRLKTNPQDANALFAMTISTGMQADYASLIDKHQLGSLKMIREADKYAKQLLAVAPDAADAYLTLGAANYIIGSMPVHKRLFLVFKGIHSNKKEGIRQLEIAATHGHYLRPFAKILLALAALREKKTEVARTQLMELVAEFPENPLFASELAKIGDASAHYRRGNEVPHLLTDNKRAGRAVNESRVRSLISSPARHCTVGQSRSTHRRSLQVGCGSRSSLLHGCTR